jgi:hypothetical protein
VAVWRELRGIGALSLGHGVWAVPATAGFTEGLNRAVELAEAGEGQVVLLDATRSDEADSARLENQFTALREAQWTEFVAECVKFEAELERETGQGKFTLAELDEAEQSLERLRRRWYRELMFRDLSAPPRRARRRGAVWRSSTWSGTRRRMRGSDDRRIGVHELEPGDEIVAARPSS